MTRENQKSRELATNTRREEALELFNQGNSYREIAEQMGITPHTAYDHIRKAAAEQTKRCGELAEDALGILNRRTDMLWQKAWKEVERGNVRAMEVAVKIIERQAKLYGLDNTPTVQVNNMIGVREQIDSDIAKLRARIETVTQQPTIVDGTIDPGPEEQQ